MKYKPYSIFLITLSIIFVITLISHINKWLVQKEINAHKSLLESKLKQNPEEIISKIKELISSGDFLIAYRTADQFKEFENTDFKELASKAWEKYCKQEEERITTRLKNIPATQYKDNINEYAKLVKLFPENERYKQKERHYRKKFAENEKRKEQKRRQLIVKFGIPPEQSAWDGSYPEVRRFLKQVANDPDSINMDGCTKVYQTENGWLVGCDYRGRNAFGGMVRNSNWFIIRHGIVVDVKESSVYKP